MEGPVLSFLGMVNLPRRFPPRSNLCVEATGAFLSNQSPWCWRLGTLDRFGAFALVRRRSLVNRACKPGGTSTGG
jgi:hypothetical protein